VTDIVIELEQFGTVKEDEIGILRRAADRIRVLEAGLRHVIANADVDGCRCHALARIALGSVGSE